MGSTSGCYPSEKSVKERFAEEQIIRVVQEADGAVNVRDVRCKHNSTEQIFYRRRNRFGGMDVSQAK